MIANANSKQTVEDLLRSLLLPFISRNRSRVTKFHSDHHHGTIAPLHTALVEILHDLIVEDCSVFIVIDAIDECPRDKDQRAALLDFTTLMLSWSLPNLHLLVINRPEWDIRDAHCLIVTSHFDLTLQVDADIDRYIRRQLRLPGWQRWPQDLLETIAQTLATKVLCPYGDVTFCECA